MLKIGVVGAAGRMGRTNIRETVETEGAELASGLEHHGNGFVGMDAGELIGEKPIGVKVTDDIQEFISRVDAIIDFSSPASSLSIAELAAKKGLIHIIGTTGFTKEEEAKLKEYAKNARIVCAPNFSIGVNLLFALTQKVSGILDETYDIEIVEMHHNKKVDSPSGTALGLGKAAAKGRKVELDNVWCKARDGQIGARPKGEIGFATLRGGDVVGDHSVIFATGGERVELTHKASDRKVFSKGAVRAALWAKDKKPGFYTMSDVLGL